MVWSPFQIRKQCFISKSHYKIKNNLIWSDSWVEARLYFSWCYCFSICTTAQNRAVAKIFWLTRGHNNNQCNATNTICYIIWGCDIYRGLPKGPFIYYVSTCRGGGGVQFSQLSNAREQSPKWLNTRFIWGTKWSRQVRDESFTFSPRIPKIDRIMICIHSFSVQK